jgi:hypothetical protein
MFGSQATLVEVPATCQETAPKVPSVTGVPRPDTLVVIVPTLKKRLATLADPKSK